MSTLRFGIISLVLFLTSSIYAQRVTGLVFDDKLYQNSARLSPSLKFTANDIPVFSLKKHCPTPGNQGNMGSCVGWATSYAALTIAQAIRENQTTTAVITDKAKSALYVYNQIKIMGCSPGGAIIDEALALIKDKGACEMKDFNPSTCEIIPGNLENIKAKDTRIKDYFTLFDLSANEEKKVSATINSLLAKKPVVIGMNVTESFDKVPSSGLWAPVAGEAIMGGHAMCVIGFDQLTKRFEVINSWGTDWGKGGFFTISFADYAKYCKYGYQFSLVEKPNPNNSFTFKGTFEINKLKGYDSNTDKFEYEKIKALKVADEYKIAGGTINKNDFFKIFARNLKIDNYLYIFSIKPDKTTELLFPSTDLVDGATVKDIPIIPSDNAYVEIPSNERKAITADQSGADYLVFLYSVKQIKDIETIVKAIQSQNGTVLGRLQNIFTTSLVPASSINYSADYIGFSGEASTGSIVPLIINVSVNE